MWLSELKAPTQNLDEIVSSAVNISYLVRSRFSMEVPCKSKMCERVDENEIKGEIKVK